MQNDLTSFPTINTEAGNDTNRLTVVLTKSVSWTYFGKNAEQEQFL